MSGRTALPSRTLGNGSFLQLLKMAFNETAGLTRESRGRVEVIQGNFYPAQAGPGRPSVCKKSIITSPAQKRTLRLREVTWLPTQGQGMGKPDRWTISLLQNRTESRCCLSQECFCPGKGANQGLKGNYALRTVAETLF